MYKLIKEIKNEMIRKEVIKGIITEVINEKMDKLRQELQHWKTTMMQEMQKIMNSMPNLSIEAGAAKEKSGTIKNESVIIIKLREEEDDNYKEELQ